MGNPDFHFSLLRVSIIQLLRSIGVDRCKPEIIDILTDLYIRYLDLITKEVQKLMETTNRNEIALQDITQALINLRVLNPMKILDIYEIHDDENSNLKNITGDLFLRWIVGDIPDNARTIAKVDKSLLNAENVKKPVIKEYLDQSNNMEIGLNTDGTNSGFNGNVSGTGAININDSDENWLQFLMKKKSKFDKSDKFKNTVLTDVVSTVHLNKPGNGLNSNVNAELDEDIPEYLREKLFTTKKENVKLSYEESLDDFDSF